MSYLDTEEEKAAYDEGFDQGSSDGYSTGWNEAKRYVEKQLHQEFHNLTDTIANSLASHGHPAMARSLREWALMSPHVRSFTPPRF